MTTECAAYRGSVESLGRIARLAVSGGTRRKSLAIQSALLFHLSRLALCYGMFMALVVLEDNPDRSRAIRLALESREFPLAGSVLPSGPEFIGWFKFAPGDVGVSSRDHDLQPLAHVLREPVAGADTRDRPVVPDLTEPAILHFSNTHDTEVVKFELSDRAISARRPAAYDGLRWIDRQSVGAGLPD